MSDDWRQGPWRCICGAGDDAEFHSLMCVASNTPDGVWRSDTPPLTERDEAANVTSGADQPSPKSG